jgi:hypothetical protein
MHFGRAVGTADGALNSTTSAALGKISMFRPLSILILGFWMVSPCRAQSEEPPPKPSGRVQVDGVFPDLTVMAQGVGSNSETGIGALIPWADRLWAIGYVAHIKGQGIGLYEIGADLTMRRRPESVTDINVLEIEKTPGD